MKMLVSGFAVLFVFSSLLQAKDIVSSEQDIFSKLEGIENSLSDIESEYRDASALYLNPLTLNSDYKEPVVNKIKKADFYFNKKDYISSGSIYYSILISLDKKDRLWEEVVFKLAESLYSNRNYISASRYYDMILTEIQNSRHKIDALKRLISASYHLGNYAVSKKYYTEFIEIGYDISKDQDLLYFLAKSLFFDGQIEESMNVFSSLNEQAVYYPQGLYFLGVIDIGRNELKKALINFEKVAAIEKTDRYHMFNRVYEQSILAAARISFELGDLDKSVRYYALLDKRSEHFAQAYYELCWTYIKREEFTRAVDSLRLIKYIAPDSIVAPQAELLEGSLLIRLKKYGEAMVVFNDVVKKYSSVKKELNSIENKSFLDSVKAGRLSSKLSPYSPVVRSLLKENKKFSNSMKLSDDVEILEKEIEKVDKLEQKIGSIVDNKNAAALFPPLKKGSSSAIFLQNKVASIRNELLEIRKNHVWEQLTDNEKGKFSELEKQKKQLTEVVDNISLSPDQIEKKAAEYAKLIIEMEEELHRTAIQTRSIYEQLDGISISYAREKGEAVENDKLMERINKEKDEILSAIESLTDYKNLIEKEKNRLILGGDIISRVVIARNSLNKIVLQQDAILSKTTFKDGTVEKRISDLLRKSDELDRSLDIFFKDLNDAVKEIINKIRMSYESERNNLNEYKSELSSVKREITEMATLAMYSNINKVKSSFSELILKADLGIIDVAWEKKEEATSEKIQLKTKKAKEIRDLYLNLEDDE